MAITIPSGVVTFANQPPTTVATGGTAALSQGAAEAWTVGSGASFPVAATSTFPATFFMVADTASTSEIICVTVASTASPWVWNVTRGAEGTTPVTHATGFTVQQVVTAGSLTNFKQASNAEITPVTVGNTTASITVATYTPILSDIEAGASFEIIAFGPYAVSTGARPVLTWSVLWGAVTVASLKSGTNAPAFITTVGAGASFDVNGTLALLSSTQATCNINWWYVNGALTVTGSNATTANNGSGSTASSTPVNISGDGPITLTAQWSTASTSDTLTVVSPLIYRAA